MAKRRNHGHKYSLRVVAFTTLLLFGTFQLVVIPAITASAGGGSTQGKKAPISKLPAQPVVPTKEVKHMWQGDRTGGGTPRNKFFVLDVYRYTMASEYNPSMHDATDLAKFKPTGLKADLTEYMLVMGDGEIAGMTFPGGNTYKTDLQCDWHTASGGQTMATIPMIQFMRWKNGDIDYRREEKNYPNTFSWQDAYQVHYIFCPIPTGDLSLKRLYSKEADWAVDLSASTPVPSPPQDTSHTADNRLMICMAPMYGAKNVRWFIEWLEFHRAQGVHHINIPLYDDESDHKAKPLWDLLRFYRKEGFITIHHWSSEESHDFTSDGKIYERAKYVITHPDPFLLPSPCPACTFLYAFHTHTPCAGQSECSRVRMYVRACVFV
jgi:hypothetical protein